MASSSFRKKLGWVGTYLVWMIATLIVLVPIYWLFIVSARSRVELFGRPSFIQTSFYAQNYTKPLFDPTFQRYMINSIIIATSNAILVSVLAILATYALSRWRLKGDENIFFWTITNRMGPPAAFLLPLFLLFTRVFRIGGWTMFDTRKIYAQLFFTCFSQIQ